MDDQSNEIILMQYVNNTIYCSTKEKCLLSHMDKCTQSLEKIDKEISDSINNIKNSILNAIDFSLSQYDRSKYTNKVCFLIYKFLNLFMKYQSLRYSQLVLIKKTVNEFKDLISVYIKQKIPIHINISDFVSSVFQKVDKSIPKLEFKLQALFHYVKNIPNIERFNITNNEIIKEMKRLADEVDIKNNYIPFNQLDLMLETYIESNTELLDIFLHIGNIKDNYYTKPDQDINIACKSSNKYKNNINNFTSTNLILNDFDYFVSMLISKSNLKSKANPSKLTKLGSEENNQNHFNFKLFENTIQKVYFQITSSNKVNYQMFTVLRCSALRYLCNRYYLAHCDEWLEKDSDDYIQNCLKIVKQTPRDLQISSDIIPADSSDKSFQLLFSDENFKSAIESMFSIQFFTCPIDIWNGIQASIDSALKGARNLSSSDSIAANIAFDDFFSIILPVFASAQITSPTSLHSYLQLFKSFEKTNSLNLTSLLAVALTSYFVRNEKS